MFIIITLITIITLLITIKIIKNNKIKNARRAKIESIRCNIAYSNAGAEAYKDYRKWSTKHKLRYSGPGLSYQQKRAYTDCIDSLMYAHYRKF